MLPRPLIPNTEDLAAATPRTKVLAKVETSKKQRASTSRPAPRQVAKRTISIPLITPVRSTATIPLGGNQSGGSILSTTKGPSNPAIMDDVADTPSRSVSHSRAFTTPLSRDPIGDAIDRDFFPFVCGPYYAEYLEDDMIAGSYEISHEQWEGPHEPILSVLSKEMFKDPQVCKTVVDQFPTPREMVWIEALSDERLAGKMSVLHCLMMSHGGELLAWYRGLLKSHNDHVSTLKKQVTDLKDKVTAFDVAYVKAKDKGKDRKKKIKSLSKSMDQFTDEAARLASDLNQARRSDSQKGDHIAATQTYPGDIYALIEGYKHYLAEKDVGILRLKAFPPDELLSLIIDDYSARPLFALLELEPDTLARLAVVLAPKVVGVSPSSLKESTVTLASSLVKLFPKDAPPSFATATEQPSQEHNEEWLNAMVDTADEDMVDVASDSRFASFGSPNAIVALSVKKEKESTPLIPKMSP
ncbi:hypothetical protein Tco_1403048 [Tanacetum coccineum]